MKSSVANLTVWVVVVGLLAAPRGLAAQRPPLWRALDSGDHDVGFTRIWELDPTRVWPRSPALDSARGVVARPVRIDVWFPARCARRERMTLGDYFRMDAPAAEFEDLVFLTRRWDEYSYRGLAADSAAYDELVSARTAACPDGEEAPGRFPLVVYSAGWYNRAPDNTVLAEYLASHGFVVATVPQLNPGLWTFEFASDPRSVENQIRDLEVALGTLIELDGVDRRRVAALGYSTGGDVALLLEGRNPMVDVVVGLDPSFALGPENDVFDSPFFSAERHTSPLCVLRRRPDDRAAADEILESLSAAPRLVVELPEADHGSFSDDPVQRRLLGRGSDEAVRIHAAVARAVRTCLAAGLAPDRGSFDGGAVARRLRGPGAEVRYLPASPGGGDS